MQQVNIQVKVDIEEVMELLVAYQDCLLQLIPQLQDLIVKLVQLL